MILFVDRPRLAVFWPFAFLLLLLPLGAPLLTGLRLLDSGICAQLPGHMLMPGGVTLPLCARNTGIYTGAALAFGILRAEGRQRAMLPPTPRLIALLLTLIAMMGLDGLNSVATDLALPHLYAPSNAARLATGLGAGMALALLLAPVIARAHYGDLDQRPPLEHAVGLLRYLGAALIAFAVIWSVAPWTLYPIALLSNAGLLAVVIGVNRIAVAAIGGVAGNVRHPRLSSSITSVTLVCIGIGELALLAGLKVLLLGP